MPGECGRDEALFSTANDKSRQACLSCVQLAHCGLQSQEIVLELQARDYVGETVIAGEAVMIEPVERPIDPREVLRPHPLEWNLKVLPDDPAQALQVLRQAHMTKQLSTRGVLASAFELTMEPLIFRALNELRTEQKGYDVNVLGGVKQAELIARSLFRQRTHAGKSGALSPSEQEHAKAVIKLFMEDTRQFQQLGNFPHPGAVVLYYSPAYYRRLARHYASFLYLSHIQNIIKNSPLQAYIRLEEKIGNVPLPLLPRPPRLAEIGFAAKPEQEAAKPHPLELKKTQAVTPTFPSLPEVLSAAPISEEFTLQAPAPESEPPLPIPDSLSSGEANLESREDLHNNEISFPPVKTTTPRARVDMLPDHLRAAVYMAHCLSLPRHLREAGWHSSEKVQRAVGVQSRQELIEYVTHHVMPKIRGEV